MLGRGVTSDLAVKFITTFQLEGLAVGAGGGWKGSKTGGHLAEFDLAVGISFGSHFYSLPLADLPLSNFSGGGRLKSCHHDESVLV